MRFVLMYLKRKRKIESYVYTTKEDEHFNFFLKPIVTIALCFQLFSIILHIFTQATIFMIWCLPKAQVAVENISWLFQKRIKKLWKVWVSLTLNMVRSWVGGMHSRVKGKTKICPCPSIPTWHRRLGELMEVSGRGEKHSLQ